MYKLPETLSEDIVKLGSLAKEYQDGKIETVQFKAYRVPMGIYEQRQDEVYMSRVRTTGGVIYPQQFLSLIDIAINHKSDLLHITTRQEIQIQNLDLDEVEPILNELQQIGLSTKGGGGNTIRNILVSSNSGISADEVFDTTPYAMELTTRLIAEPDSYLLPRKMKIAFSSSDKEIDYAAINDIGFVAKTRNGEKGFLVYAGGGAGAKPTIGWVLFDFVPEVELYLVAEALKKFFSDHGNRKNKHKARLRFVFFRLGEEETIRLIKQYFEASKSSYVPLDVNTNEYERPNFDYIPTNINTDTAYDIWHERYVTAQRQTGYSSIIVPFTLGNFSLENEKLLQGVRDLLGFVDKFGKHTIRFTTTQNIQLRNIPDIALPELYEKLKQIVAELGAPLLVNNIVSCTGADTCRLGIGLSKGLATAIRSELLKSSLDLDKISNAHIHVSGCPNSCGQQLWADIGFSGKILRNDRIYPGYQVYLAANRAEHPQLAESVGSISAKDIPQFVHRLLKSYLEVSQNYETLTDYLHAEGKEEAVKLIAEYKAIPSFAENENYYYDWGAESVFSVIGRGVAECSAGMFDMIDVDLGFINTNIDRLKTETDTKKINDLLYDIIYSSSRMLLVTRNAEPKTTNDVFDLFIKSFIEFGFVEERFRDLIHVARDSKAYDFSTRSVEVYELAQTVTILYKNMDDSLQFKTIPHKEV